MTDSQKRKSRYRKRSYKRRCSTCWYVKTHRRYMSIDTTWVCQVLDRVVDPDSYCDVWPKSKAHRTEAHKTYRQQKLYKKGCVNCQHLSTYNQSDDLYCCFRKEAAYANGICKGWKKGNNDG